MVMIMTNPKFQAFSSQPSRVTAHAPVPPLFPVDFFSGLVGPFNTRVLVRESRPRPTNKFSLLLKAIVPLARHHLNDILRCRAPTHRNIAYPVSCQQSLIT